MFFLEELSPQRCWHREARNLDAGDRLFTSRTPIDNYEPLKRILMDFRLLHLKPISRLEAYQADVVYGINSEFGFDYLRDNMAQTIQNVV